MGSKKASQPEYEKVIQDHQSKLGAHGSRIITAHAGGHLDAMTRDKTTAIRGRRGADVAISDARRFQSSSKNPVIKVANSNGVQTVGNLSLAEVRNGTSAKATSAGRSSADLARKGLQFTGTQHRNSIYNANQSTQQTNQLIGTVGAVGGYAAGKYYNAQSTEMDEVAEAISLNGD